MTSKYTSEAARAVWRPVMAGLVETVDHALRGIASMGAAAPPDTCRALWAEIVVLLEAALFPAAPPPREVSMGVPPTGGSARRRHMHVCCAVVF